MQKRNDAFTIPDFFRGFCDARAIDSNHGVRELRRPAPATGDRKYLEEGLRFLRFTGLPTRDATIRGGAKQYRSFMPFLLLAHEAGMLAELERLP